jgi:hypothetical protein
MRKRLIVLACILVMVVGQRLNAQTSTVIPAGSFIIDMGVMPQTVGNGLKPYGMIYDLLKNYQVPIHWVINTSKAKDGTDFTYGGYNFKGGPFIIESSFRTAAVNTAITSWQSQGVIGVTTTAPITVPVWGTFFTAPNWTLDKLYGSVITSFFTYAGIPASAYGGTSSSGWKDPSQLTDCDDIFVLPHSSPTWPTHSYLYSFPTTWKGGIWMACNGGSELHDLFNPADHSMQINLLISKTGNVPAGITSTYYENSAVLYNDHGNGSPPYAYSYSGEPVMQFVGTLDAATQYGLEQIYIPVAGADWYPSTHVGVYDATFTRTSPASSTALAAVLAWGPGFGLAGSAKIMLEGGHNVSGTAPANIAAQRAFFNYAFQVSSEKNAIPTLSGLPDTLYSGTSYGLSYTLSYILTRSRTNTYTNVWSSSCGGTFLPNSTSAVVTFIPPSVTTPVSCTVTLTVLDDCNRQTFDSKSVMVMCNAITVVPTITNPCFDTPNSGSIEMSITPASGPYTWSWTKSGGGIGAGTGTTITGLTAGTYTVTVASSGGCSTQFTISLTTQPQIIVTAIPTPVRCYGASTGTIDVTVSGGSPGYTFLWNGGVTSQNRSGLPAGSYSLTVTDSKGCTATTTSIVTQPAAIVITPTITQVTCNGLNNGIINLTVTNGTLPYTYLWNDGTSTQNRTGLSPGTYSVTITDANGCTNTLSGITITQAAASLSLSATQVNILCYGSSTGSINLTVSGGTSPYTYSWNGPNSFTATSEDISGLAAGIYSVVVPDSKGCTANLSVTITQPTPLTLSILATQPTCPAYAQQNSTDGAITLTVSGGVTPYNFSWVASNGGIIPSGQSTNQNLTGLVAGKYTVTVTDGNGCIKTAFTPLNYTNSTPVLPGGIFK